MQTLISDQRHVMFDGHRVVYRTGGAGSAIVVIRQNRARLDTIQLRHLRESHRVVQVDPLGYAASDRPAGYPAETLPQQVLSVLDHLNVDRFVVWGYSKSGAMSATVARATERATAVVAAAFPFLTHPSQAKLRTGYREPFYQWFWSFDWAQEFARMSVPKLVYFGDIDFGEAGRGLRRTREQLQVAGVDVLEFAGLDHRTCGEDEPMTTQVTPAVADWIHHHLGESW